MENGPKLNHPMKTRARELVLSIFDPQPNGEYPGFHPLRGEKTGFLVRRGQPAALH